MLLNFYCFLESLLGIVNYFKIDSNQQMLCIFIYNSNQITEIFKLNGFQYAHDIQFISFHRPDSPIIYGF